MSKDVAWFKWKIRHQGKQIVALVDKLNNHDSRVAAIIREYQMQCEETAAKLADDESETGQLMYWRADGASDALEALLFRLGNIGARVEARIEKACDRLDELETG